MNGASVLSADERTRREAGRLPLPGWLPLALCVLFVVLLVAQEQGLLLALNGQDQPLPSLSWRLLWPLGCLGFGLLLPAGLRWYFLAFAGALSSLALVLDRAYFDFFRSVTSLRAAVSARQLWDVRDSVAHLISAQEVGNLLVFGLLALHGVVGRHRTRAPLFRSLGPAAWLRPAPCAGVALLCACALLAQIARRTPVHEATHHLGRSEWVLPKDHWASQYSNASFAATFGVFNYHVRDLVSYVRERSGREELSAQRRAQIRGFLASKERSNRRASPFFGLAAGRHVVLVQMESWQHFVLGLRVGRDEVTPTLSLLAQQGLSWDYIVDVTHLGRTSDAEFAVMTGLLPDTRKAAAFSSLDAVPVALPRELAKRGYRTASFHGYERSFWNRAYTHPEFGIQEMFFEESFAGEPEIGLGTADPVVFEFVARKLEEWRAPGFAFVISLSSHHPYVYTPEAYEALFADVAGDQAYGLLGPYLRSVRYADDALGGFVESLRRRGLLEKTLLVVYGDHDLGGVAARRPLEAVGPRLFTPLEDRVPLVIWIPGEEEFVAAHRSEFVGATGGLHDLSPTILHLLGVETPLGVEGTHLFVPDAERDPIPLPVPAGAFVHRQAIYAPPTVAPMGPSRPPLSGVPSPERSFEAQLVVRDLLDSRTVGVVTEGPVESARAAR